MRILRSSALLFALVVVAPAVTADEIIHFTNGTALPVKSYTIEDGMIKVNLGDAAVMAFPEYLVDHIEGTEKELTGKAYDANLRKGGPGGKGNRGVNQAIPDFSAIQEVEIMALPEDVKVDPNTGLATHRPFAGSAATNRRKMQNAGNMRARTARMAPDRGGYTGARRVGGKTVINKSSSSRRLGSVAPKEKVRPTLAHPSGPPPTVGDSESPE